MPGLSDAEVSILIKAVDEASAVLNNIGSNAQASSQKVTASWQESIKTLIAVGNVVNAVGNIFDSYHNLQGRIENAELRVIDAREALNKLTEEGKQGTEEYVNAQRRLIISQNNLERANTAVVGTYIGMFASVGSLLISLPALATAIRGATAASLAFVAANIYWIAIGAAVIALIYGVAVALKKMTDGQIDLIGKTKEWITAGTDQITTLLGIKKGEDDLNVAYDSQIEKLEKIDELLTRTGKKGKSAFEYSTKQDARLQELYKKGRGRSAADDEELANLERLVQGFRLPPTSKTSSTTSNTNITVNGNINVENPQSVAEMQKLLNKIGAI